MVWGGGQHMRVSQTHTDTPCAACDELGGIQLTAHYSLSEASPRLSAQAHPKCASDSASERESERARALARRGPVACRAEPGTHVRGVGGGGTPSLPPSLPSDAHASPDINRLPPSSQIRQIRGVIRALISGGGARPVRETCTLSWRWGWREGRGGGRSGRDGRGGGGRGRLRRQATD